LITIGSRKTALITATGTHVARCRARCRARDRRAADGHDRSDDRGDDRGDDPGSARRNRQSAQATDAAVSSGTKNR
jgi:hypothetical protein